MIDVQKDDNELGQNAHDLFKKTLDFLYAELRKHVPIKTYSDRDQIVAGITGAMTDWLAKLSADHWTKTAPLPKGSLEFEAHKKLCEVSLKDGFRQFIREQRGKCSSMETVSVEVPDDPVQRATAITEATLWANHRMIEANFPHENFSQVTNTKRGVTVAIVAYLSEILSTHWTIEAQHRAEELPRPFEDVQGQLKDDIEDLSRQLATVLSGFREKVIRRKLAEVQK